MQRLQEDFFAVVVLCSVIASRTWILDQVTDELRV
jgi:hypothetical protein